MGSGASKIAFRDVLQQLGERDVPPNEVVFWEKLWQTATTPHVSSHKNIRASTLSRRRRSRHRDHQQHPALWEVLDARPLGISHSKILHTDGRGVVSLDALPRNTIIQ